MRIAFAQILVGLLLGALLVFSYNEVMPVHIGMHAKSWTITSNTISADIIGYKVRNCDYIRGTSVGYVQRNNTIVEIPFTVSQQLTRATPSIKYRIDFGNWIWGTENGENIEVFASMKYKCGSYIVNENVGPFKVPT